MKALEYLLVRGVTGGSSYLTASLMSVLALLALTEKSPAASILRSCNCRARSCLPRSSSRACSWLARSSCRASSCRPRMNEPRSAAAALMSAVPSEMATVAQAGIGTEQYEPRMPAPPPADTMSSEGLSRRRAFARHKRATRGTGQTACHADDRGVRSASAADRTAPEQAALLRTPRVFPRLPISARAGFEVLDVVEAPGGPPC
jgi:hypothetical protein